jgi:YD repeat-containing protein
LTARTVRDLSGEVIGQFEYLYDRRGNMVQATDLLMDQTKHFTYDATNRMVLGVNAAGEEGAYTFNGLGHLVAHNGVAQVYDHNHAYQRVLQNGS